MPYDKLSISLILGTNRDGRQSEKVAQWIRKELDARSDTETAFFDVHDFVFPRAGYGRALKETFPEYRNAILRSDALIIVTPEYNHGYPGTLKAVLDLLLHEYKHRAVGMACVSAGPWGGARVAENLLPVLRELGLSVTRSTLYFPNVADIFDQNGKPRDEEMHRECLNGFLDELFWLARALSWGRKNLDE